MNKIKIKMIFRKDVIYSNNINLSIIFFNLKIVSSAIFLDKSDQNWML